METDREVLIWIHERLRHVYKESELVDYMHRLRAIIAKTPKQQKSPSQCINGMDELLKLLEADK